MADLTAGVVITVAPVYAGPSAVVVCVDQLMHQSVVDLVLAGHVVVADYHLQGQGHAGYGNCSNHSTACPPAGTGPPRVLQSSQQFKCLPADDHLQGQGHPECYDTHNNVSACWQMTTCRDRVLQRHCNKQKPHKLLSWLAGQTAAAEHQLQAHCSTIVGLQSSTSKGSAVHGVMADIHLQHPPLLSARIAKRCASCALIKCCVVSQSRRHAHTAATSRAELPSSRETPCCGGRFA